MDEWKAQGKLFRILADKTRIKILHRIKAGERCGCDLIYCLDISQPTLSHHLKVLHEQGIITGEKDKNKVVYSLNQDKLDEVWENFVSLLDKDIDC